ncbi:LOW QUALITY PROTEIN: hypothetical protein CVT26_007944, partial [Gymnopilus dilepis]
LVDNGLKNPIRSFAYPHGPPPATQGNGPAEARHSPSPPSFDWGLYESFEDTAAGLSHQEQAVQHIAQSLLVSICSIRDSLAPDPEEVERSIEEEEVPEAIFIVDDGEGASVPRKRARASYNVENDAGPPARPFLWLLKAFDVDDVPSVKSMQTVNAAVQKMCGIDTIMYEGKLEFANPKVRPHLSVYPEDSGLELSEARQGSRWLHEVPNGQTTPMALIGNQDYFIYEPAMPSVGNFTW